MKNLYLIFNPIAGKAVVREKLAIIIDILTKAGYQVTVHPTQNGGDAVKAADYACRKNFDMIVCAGGDGTLSQVLCGVMSSENRIPIGYIPAGSTNDFAKALGIPKDITEAVRFIVNGKPTACDVGRFNNDYFSYVSAFGAFTNITYETSQKVKNVFGHAAYLAEGAMSLSDIRPYRMRIEFDDKVIEDDFIYGMVTNSSSIAGLLSLSDFLLDDGRFEVTLIKKPSSFVQLERIFRTLLNINEKIDNEYIEYFRADKIKFTSLSHEPVSWTRDGEFGGNNRVNIVENCHRAVEFVIDAEHNHNFSLK